MVWVYTLGGMVVVVGNSYKLIVGLWIINLKKTRIISVVMNMDRYIVQKWTVIKRVKKMLSTSNTHRQIWTVYNLISLINHMKTNLNHLQAYYQQTLVDIAQSYSNPKISSKEPAQIQLHYQLKKSVKMSTCKKSPGLIQGIIYSIILKTRWSYWLSRMCSKEHVIFLSISIVRKTYIKHRSLNEKAMDIMLSPHM